MKFDGLELFYQLIHVAVQPKTRKNIENRVNVNVKPLRGTVSTTNPCFIADFSCRMLKYGAEFKKINKKDNE